MKSITIHDLDDSLEVLLEQTAKDHGLSLNRTVKMLLRKALGLEPNGDGERRADFAESIRTGWRLAAANLGPMFILLLVMFVLGVVLGIVILMFTMPLTWLGMGLGYARPLGELPGIVQTGPLLLVGLAFTVVYTLLGGFVQAAGLAIYAHAYRELTGKEAAVPATSAQPVLTPGMA